MQLFSAIPAIPIFLFYIALTMSAGAVLINLSALLFLIRKRDAEKIGNLRCAVFADVCHYFWRPIATEADKYFIHIPLWAIVSAENTVPSESSRVVVISSNHSRPPCIAARPDPAPSISAACLSTSDCHAATVRRNADTASAYAARQTITRSASLCRLLLNAATAIIHICGFVTTETG